MGLLLSFYDDAGIIAINEHLFSMLDVGALDANGEVVQVVDAVASLRFFVRLLELGQMMPWLLARMFKLLFKLVFLAYMSC